MKKVYMRSVMLVFTMPSSGHLQPIDISATLCLQAGLQCVTGTGCEYAGHGGATVYYLHSTRHHPAAAQNQ